MNGVKRKRIGNYPDICQRVGRIGPRNLIRWVDFHPGDLRELLVGHVATCKRCQLVQAEALSRIGENTEHEFDASICSHVVEHRQDLIFWILRMEDPFEKHITIEHLKGCPKCCLTEDEHEAISEINPKPKEGG